MPLVDLTNTSQLGSVATVAKQGSITTSTSRTIGAVPAPDNAELPAHLRDPTFGLGEAVIATPALAMRTERMSSEGGLCISAAPKPCVLEPDGSGTSYGCDGTSSHFRLGMCYLQGKGVQQDAVRAVECFVKAADAGDSNAQFNLAVCFTQGLGCDRDDVKAFHYFSCAAEQGDPKAQLQIGVCHIVGRGTPFDEAKAAAAFRKAAEAGDPTAQYNLGVCLGKGRGVEKDPKEAAVWYRKSAEQNDPMAQFRLALCHATGKGIDKCAEEAVTWYRKAAQANHGGALFNLGVCYAQGDGVDRDDTRAVEFYRQAAELGVVQAQHNLALCLLTGAGAAKDAEQAVEWYLKAADQGDAKAQFAAGVCFETGQGATKDAARAAQLYAAASEQGNVKAIVAMGLCYRSGAGVEPDLQKALQMFEAAAHQGNHRGMYHLASHFLNVDADEEKALKWYKAAAEKGNRDALEAVKRMTEPGSVHKEGKQRGGKRVSPGARAGEEEHRERRSSAGLPDQAKDSFADLSSTSNMLDLDQPIFSGEASADGAKDEDRAGPDAKPDASFAAQPDKRFSCPGMGDTSTGLSSSQFDVPGRQSMAPQPADGKDRSSKAKKQMQSSLGRDNVDLPKAYSQSPAAKVRCGISSFFKKTVAHKS